MRFSFTHLTRAAVGLIATVAMTAGAVPASAQEPDTPVTPAEVTTTLPTTPGTEPTSPTSVASADTTAAANLPGDGNQAAVYQPTVGVVLMPAPTRTLPFDVTRADPVVLASQNAALTDPARTGAAAAAAYDALGGVENLPAPDQLRARYASLSTALLTFYANSGSQPIGTLVADESLLASMGIDPAVLAGNESLVTDDDVEDLNNALVEAGAAPPAGGNYQSLSDAADDIMSRMSTPDGIVVASASKFAADMAKLKMPTLTAPSAPRVDDSWVQSASTESLMFGLMADKSLTSMLVDAPSIYQKASSGVMDPQVQAAWTSALRNGAAALTAQLGSGLPSPCHAAMLAAYGSGSSATARNAVPGGSACNSCIAAGVTMNAHLQRVLDPGAYEVYPQRGDGRTVASEIAGMTPAQREAVLKANPGLADALDKVTSDRALDPLPDAPGCVASSTAVQSTLTSVLPDLLKRVR